MIKENGIIYRDKMDKLSELEKRIDKLEVRLKKVEGIKNNVHSSSNFEKELLEIIEKAKPQDLILLSLLKNTKQSKSEIQEQLKNWGCNKKTLSWFKGGNFKQRLIDGGFIHVVDKKEKKEIFALTDVKGVKKTQEIMKTYGIDTK